MHAIFRVIVVTDPQTNKQTHRQDRLQYTALQLARSVIRTMNRGTTFRLIGIFFQISLWVRPVPISGLPVRDFLQPGCSSCHSANSQSRHWRSGLEVPRWAVFSIGIKRQTFTSAPQFFDVSVTGGRTVPIRRLQFLCCV